MAIIGDGLVRLVKSEIIANKVKCLNKKISQIESTYYTYTKMTSKTKQFSVYWYDIGFPFIDNIPIMDSMT